MVLGGAQMLDNPVLVKPSYHSALDTSLMDWVEDNYEALRTWFRETTRWSADRGPAEYECSFEEFCVVQYEQQLDTEEADYIENENDYDSEEEDEWFI